MTGFKSKKKAAKEKLIMNTEDDEFRRIEAEAKRREQASEDDDTQGYTSEMLLAEAYRCGFEAGAVAEREACAKLVDPGKEHRRDARWGYIGGNEGVELLDKCAAAIRARGTT